MAKKTVEFIWEDTGELEITLQGNQSAVLKFFPSKEVIAKTLAKFSKTACNQSKDCKGKLNQHEKEDRQNEK